MTRHPGITRSVQGRTLSISAEADGAFRIHVAPSDKTPPTDGTHLDPRRRRPRVTVRRKVLSTRAASLRVLRSGREIVLQNHAGDALLAVKPCRDDVQLRSQAAGTLHGGADRRPGKRNTRQARKPGIIRSYVGNGVSAVPFAWHTAGWAVLVLAEDDRRVAIKPRDKRGRSFAVCSGDGVSDVIVMAAPTLQEALSRLGAVTGHAPVPPLWSLGFLHCRWGYKSLDEIRKTWHEFRARRCPVDAFIYDFEWYARKADYMLPIRGRADFSDFEWNVRIFSDPLEILAESRALGIRSVGIRKPRLGNRHLLRRASERGWGLDTWKQEGLDAKAIEDGMAARTLDFRREDVRRWYWERNRRFIREGMDGWWNDEGEQFPTLYYWWNRAQADGEARDFPRKRFWSISRAYSIGMARLGAAVWTGDSRTEWKNLRAEVCKILAYGIAGMPWVCCDLGGFQGDPDPELMTRYMQLGVFFPIMRTHSCIRRIPRLPWNFGEEAGEAMRRAIEWRYRLLPYTYSLAHETAATGVPLARHMVLEFPGRTFKDEWEQWMFGPSILAAPVLGEKGKRRVHLPRGVAWFDLETGERDRGGQTLRMDCGLADMPAWQRGGSIVVLAPVVQHTGRLAGKPLEVRVAPGARAAFVLVEDDGESLEYRSGEKLTTCWRWSDRTRTLTCRSRGSYPGMPRKRCWTLRILECGPVNRVTLNGRAVRRTTRRAAASRRAWRLESNGQLVVTTGPVNPRKPLCLQIT